MQKKLRVQLARCLVAILIISIGDELLLGTTGRKMLWSALFWLTSGDAHLSGWLFPKFGFFLYAAVLGSAAYYYFHDMEADWFDGALAGSVCYFGLHALDQIDFIVLGIVQGFPVHLLEWNKYEFVAVMLIFTTFGALKRWFVLRRSDLPSLISH